MGVTAETVSRWENGRERREPMGAVADRLLRLMVVTQAPKPAYTIDALAELEDEPAPARVKLAADRQGWHPEPVAA
jgi:transcriptional regulator with XRE-family HTH domain